MDGQDDKWVCGATWIVAAANAPEAFLRVTEQLPDLMYLDTISILVGEWEQAHAPVRLREMTEPGVLVWGGVDADTSHDPFPPGR